MIAGPETVENDDVSTSRITNKDAVEMFMDHVTENDETNQSQEKEKDNKNPQPPEKEDEEPAQPHVPIWKTRQPVYGHSLEPEEPAQEVRVCLQKLARLPVFKNADKSTQLLFNIRDYNPDVVMMNDVGIDWRHLPPQEGWDARCYDANFPYHRGRFSHNIHEDAGQQVQWGGTGLIVMNDMKSRVSEPLGTDPEHLGRWTCARIQGRDGVFLRVCSAYKPTYNNTDEGSSYQQQLRYFRSKGNYECPRKLFDLHLKHQLEEWIKEGDHVILGMDMNEDVRTGTATKMMRDLGMKEAVINLHRPDGPPETNQKNNRRIPIDGIFTTAGIVPTQVSYNHYNALCSSDHRCI